MARILVKHDDKFRLWCNTVDVWLTPLLNELDMAKALMELEYEGHTFDEAFNRIRRIRTKTDYTRPHLKWLKTFFDDRYDELCRTDRRNKRYTRSK